MTKKQQLFELIQKQKIISLQDALQIGISKSYLYKLAQDQQIQKLKNGLFTLNHIENLSEHSSLIEVLKQVPQATICLLSALQIYQVTTQLPHQIWLTLPRHAWQPKISYPPVHYTTTSPELYHFEVQNIELEGQTFKIYSLARTLADCFKYRNQIGLDVAISALKESLRLKKVSIDQITLAAQKCRVLNIIKPILETII